MKTPNLIILGSTQTALAVVRNAHKLKIKPIVFDTASRITNLSSLAQTIVFEHHFASDLLGKLTQLVPDDNTYLIATGDEWLEFIIQYRKQLEQVFKKIFHPSNNVLSICLEKKQFSIWCKQNNVPTPSFYLVEELQAKYAELKYPLFIRPVKTRHVVNPGKIPKAVEIKNEVDLRSWIKNYNSASVEPLISESLLNQNLVQYSVAAARVKDQCVSFVTVKKRPLADACAVGTYVELCQNETIEKLGRKVLELLDYQGIAEVEILHSLDTAKNYVIEINARPWLQYTIGMVAGYDFLKFLLQPDNCDFSNSKSSGVFWIDFNSDFYTCFAKGSGLVRNSKIGKLEYIRSLLKANAYAKFDFIDIRPFLFDLRGLVKLIIGK